MKKDTFAVLGLVGLALVAGALPGRISAEVIVSDATYQPSEIEAAKESIALSLMGQLQMSVGDLMWLKSMEYLHVGMVQRMPTKGEEEDGFMRHDAIGTAVGMGHAEGVNMVLDKNRDWRGLLGEIHRNVTCYQEGHVHDDPKEIIPWYQLAVRLNPRLERLYTLGAFYLTDFAGDPAEAKDLLVAGLKANPDSFEVKAALGRLFFEYADRLEQLIHEENRGKVIEVPANEAHFHPKNTKEAYQVAVDVLTEGARNALELKLAMRDKREVFDEFQTQVHGETYLFLARALTELGEYDKAIAVCDEGLEYSRHNLLRSQRRVAERLKNGETAEPVS
jgi:hypothetical protein